MILPNVKLHPYREPDVRAVEGYETMRRFVSTRMDTNLIASDALNEAITYSGGVFREMERIVRIAISRARLRKASQISLEDVGAAVAEIRSDFRRILGKAEIEILKNVHENNRIEFNEQLQPLLQLLAVLEYRNGENWFDIHPVLRKMIYD